MQNADVIAITDLTQDTAGAIVLWRLQGDTDYERLKEAFETLSLDESLLPELPSAEVALRRAVKEHEAKRMLVRSLPGRGTGYALVAEHEESAEASPLGYAVSLTVRLHKTPVVELAFSDPEHKLASKISTDFRANLDRLTATDTIGWLCEMIRVVKAVPMRDTGGVYFVPRETLGMWRQITKALRASSATYFAEIPALRSSEAVDAILDSLEREAATQLENMEGELLAANDSEEGMGGRAIQTRIGRCEAMADKLGTYERLLGVKLDTLRDRLTGLQANLAAAALLAHAERVS